MTKAITLNPYEQEILKRLSTEQLRFFARMIDDKDYNSMIVLINFIINQQKNVFFLTNEQKFDPTALYGQHAYARGGMEMLERLLRIIEVAAKEIQKREGSKK